MRASNRAISRQLARGFVDSYFGEAEMGSESHHRPPKVSKAGLAELDRTTAATLSVQGEGVIEGLYRHYQVASLHAHGFRYSQFNCTTWGK